MNFQDVRSYSVSDKIQAAQLLAADESLRDAISRFATQSRFEADFINAFLEFWGADEPDELPLDLAEETPELLLTMEWYLYDYREMDSDKRMIDLFAEVEGSRLKDLELDFLVQWQKATLAPYEVLSVNSGTGYVVRSLIAGDELVVADEPTSQDLKPGDVMVARLLPAGSYVRPSSVFRTFSAGDLPRLMASLDGWYATFRAEHHDVGWSEFLREEGYLFNDYTLERQALAGRMAGAPEDTRDRGGNNTPAPGDQDDAMLMAREQLASRYRAWLDRQTPALGGHSPRQAVESADGQRLVIALLHEMGEIEASYALAGEPAFEIADLLPALGLTMNDLQ